MFYLTMCRTVDIHYLLSGPPIAALSTNVNNSAILHTGFFILSWVGGGGGDGGFFEVCQFSL